MLAVCTLSTAGTDQADGRCRVCAQPGLRDIVVAPQAFPIASIRDPGESAVYSQPFQAPPFPLCFRHGLTLQRIHAAQPADAGLVKFYRCPVTRILYFQCIKFGKP